jgi:SAM-dependent methyltransferase
MPENDPDYYDHARLELLDLFPQPPKRLLDVGCGSGVTSAAAKARWPGVETIGIEVVAGAAQRAAERLDRVIEGSAETVDLAAAGLTGIDGVLLADVLEHLVDPWTALRRYAELLHPGGTAVVSLPNVGHWSTYAYLLRGTWPRKPEGIFDATHLRWFTLTDARDLLAQAGLEPHTVVRRGWIAWRGSRADVLAPPLLKVPGIRTLVTFQHVIASIYAPRACR